MLLRHHTIGEIEMVFKESYEYVTKHGLLDAEFGYYEDGRWIEYYDEAGDTLAFYVFCGIMPQIMDM